MLGILRVLTTENEEILLEHGKLMESALGVQSVTACIPDQPNGIYNAETEVAAIPKIVELAKEMAARKGVDALTISCAADPALDEMRDAVDLPVLGAGICGAHAACMVGSRVGVMGITDAAPSRMRQELGDHFHSYSFSVELRKTTDLMEEEAKKKLLLVAKEAIAGGADVLLFACTGFSTIRLKDYLVSHVDVPVIDLVEAQAIAYRMIMEKEGVRSAEQDV